MSTNGQIRCAIYTRKSTEEGLEQDFNTLHAQREACEAYIASQKSEGWIALAANYDDGGFSGGTLERPSLRRLLEDIEGARVNVIVVYKIDRLSRSLMDFAKLVEVFDRKKVTFVSVTQSFNTTTSMGRLTLNVLLSFAQFEREVTGERIRDKFAASKKKGIWMGGNPPMGYDIISRRLIVHPSEAETVNLIFQRYLDLGCVRALKADLADRSVVSKQWTSSSGIRYGGQPFDRGALYCLLKNRIYLGETMHKGTSYPGEHQAIVSRTLFDAVQERLAVYRRRQLGKASTRQQAPLAGLLFDDEATPMVRTYGLKSGTRRYRYYVSRTRIRGEPCRASISRVPAPPLEEVIGAAMTRFELGPLAEKVSEPGTLRRIDIAHSSLRLTLDWAAALKCWKSKSGNAPSVGSRELLHYWRGRLINGEELTREGDSLLLSLPVRAQFRGGRSGMLPGSSKQGRQALPDVSLIKALARAHKWKQMLATEEVTSIEELAARVKQERRHVGRILGLAFLSPDVTKMILAGEQPVTLRLAHLLDAAIPLSWSGQRAMFAQLAEGAAAS
jgi:site-specific DNA recombinase